MVVVKGARDSVHQDWEGGHAPQAAGLSHRKDLLHPAVPLLVVGALPQLAPEPGTPQRPLGPVMGGFHACLHHTCPPGAQLPLEGAGPGPRLVFPEPVLLQPMHQPRPCRHHPAPQSGQLWLLSLRQAPGPSDERRQAGWAPMEPSWVHGSASAHPDPGPGRHEGLARGVAPTRLPLAPRHRGVDHPPQPHHPAVPIPAGLGHGMDGCPSGLHRHGLVLGCEGRRDPLHRAVNRALADRSSQDRPATLLPGAATASRTARQRPQPGREPGTIAGGSGRGKRGFRDPATPGTARLIPHHRRHAPLDVGQRATLLSRYPAEYRRGVRRERRAAHSHRPGAGPRGPRSAPTMPGEAPGVRAGPRGGPWAGWRGAVSPREDRRRAADWHGPRAAAPGLRGPPSAPHGSASGLLGAASPPARGEPRLERQQASVPLGWDQAAVLSAGGGRPPRQRPARCPVMCPWRVNAALLTQNPANFQQTRVDQPGVAIRHSFLPPEGLRKLCRMGPDDG